MTHYNGTMGAIHQAAIFVLPFKSKMAARWVGPMVYGPTDGCQDWINIWDRCGLLRTIKPFFLDKQFQWLFERASHLHNRNGRTHPVRPSFSGVSRSGWSQTYRWWTEGTKKRWRTTEQTLQSTALNRSGHVLKRTIDYARVCVCVCVFLCVCMCVFLPVCEFRGP